MTRFSLIVRTLGLCLTGIALYGQSFTGKLTGLVTDSSAAAVPHVVVTVLNEGTGAQRRTITDGSGVFVAAELAVGRYTVRFDAPGLGQVERRMVQVDVGAETRLDITMSAKAIEQSTLSNRSKRFRSATSLYSH